MVGVDPADIVLLVIPGSISVVAIITAANATIADSAQSTLASLATAGASDTSIALGVTVTAVSQPTLALVSLAPPSAPSTSSGFDLVYLAAIIPAVLVGIICLIFASRYCLAGTGRYRSRRMSNFAKESIKHRSSVALIKEYKGPGDVKQEPGAVVPYGKSGYGTLFDEKDREGAPSLTKPDISGQI